MEGPLEVADRKLEQGDLEGARVELSRAAQGNVDARLRAAIEDKRAVLAANAGDLKLAAVLHLVAAAVARGEKPAHVADDSKPAEPTKDEVPDATAPSQLPLIEARSLIHAGAVAHIGRSHALARAALERAVEITGGGNATGGSLETRGLRAEALHNLGVLLLDVDPKLALLRLETALALDLQAGDPRAAAGTRVRLAGALRKAGDLARAATEATKARDDAQAAKLAGLAAEACFELSSIELARGDMTKALEAAKAAIDSLEPTGDKRALARAWLNAAVLGRRAKVLRAARDGLDKAEKLALEAGDAALVAAVKRERLALEPR